MEHKFDIEIGKDEVVYKAALEYEIRGEYREQTMYSPAEYPEAERTDSWIVCPLTGKNIKYENLLPDVQSVLEEEEDKILSSGELEEAALQELREHNKYRFVNKETF